MALIVQKYGGTSVANLERINAVADRVIAYRERGHRVAVVLSAMSGETNKLVALGRAAAQRPSLREMDVLQATGEQVTIALLAIVLSDRGYPARSYLAHQVAIRTDSAFGKARIEGIDTARMQADLDAGVIPVVAGFQGLDAEGNVTTLGRGGSDTTGVALAAALRADECEICTDVDGVYTADPRIVSEARRLDRVTFEEMLELASLGSKVLHPRSVEFAGKYQVPLRVLSSFEEGPGTLITTETDAMEQPIVSGIAHSKDEAKITVSGVPDVPGVASRILGPVSRASIEVDMIVQNTGADGLTDFTFTVKRDDFDRAIEILKPVQTELGARSLSGDKTIAKVSVVGVGMRSHAGVASRMFDALGAENINIHMISTSEIKISVVVAEKYMELAVRAIHEAFGLGLSAAGERV
ncbi:MAG: aspartate kinase [Pseudomonadales bacterium]|jgi:aspartate kinase